MPEPPPPPPNSEIDWLLFYDQQLTFPEKTDSFVAIALSHAHLISHAEYNYNFAKAGLLTQSEFLNNLGNVVVAKYGISSGYQFLEMREGITGIYDLKISPSFTPQAPFSIHLKLWYPSMPLSRSNISVTVNPPTSSTSTASSVASTTTSTTILAANANRKGATIWNASTANLYLDLDSGGSAEASSTDYTVAMGPGDYYEVPYGYQGQIVGVWSAVNGNALIRELT